jgi:hypothetical protein
MQQIHTLVQGDMSIDEYYSAFDHLMGVNVSYAAPQAHGIINVVLHREYTPGILFIFSQGRKDLYHV